jgi:hypothetical protein
MMLSRAAETSTSPFKRMDLCVSKRICLIGVLQSCPPDEW